MSVKTQKKPKIAIGYAPDLEATILHFMRKCNVEDEKKQLSDSSLLHIRMLDIPDLKDHPTKEELNSIDKYKNKIMALIDDVNVEDSIFNRIYSFCACYNFVELGYKVLPRCVDFSEKDGLFTRFNLFMKHVKHENFILDIIHDKDNLLTDINCTDKTLETPLTLVVREKFEKAAFKLLEEGCTIDDVTKYEETAFSLAEENQMQDFIEALELITLANQMNKSSKQIK